MNLILNEKQKYLLATAYRIITTDFEITPDQTKNLLYGALIKELVMRETTLEALDHVSRAERHIFIRRVANQIGEILMRKFGIKQTVVSDAITKFMKIMNEQSQLARS